MLVLISQKVEGNCVLLGKLNIYEKKLFLLVSKWMVNSSIM